MIIFTLFIAFIVFFLWLIGFLLLNDLSVQSCAPNISKALFIFPHPDDEALNCGGLLKYISDHGGHTTLAVLTLGERGNPQGEYDQSLKLIRKKEMELSATNFKVSKLVQNDFGDGQLSHKKIILKKYLDNLITSENPDVIITYDLSGLYGHPDHMIVAEIVSNLLKKKYPQIELWYSALPLKVIEMTKLPEHMAKDSKFKKKRFVPNSKLFIGLNFIKKIKAVSIHQSQKQSFRSALPKFIPLDLVISMQLFEYYHVC